MDFNKIFQMILDFIKSFFQQQFQKEKKMSLKGKKIMIDPGHGGPAVPGAIGPTGLTEAEVCLNVSQKLKTLLLVNGATVSMTREIDEDIGITRRANMARDFGADVFLSIHQNAFTTPAAFGIETLVFADGTPSAKLAKLVNDKMVAATGDRDRGVLVRPDLGILRLSEMPTILIESGFISHPVTEEKMKTHEWQNAIAKAICDGVIEFFAS